MLRLLKIIFICSAFTLASCSSQGKTPQDIPLSPNAYDVVYGPKTTITEGIRSNITYKTPAKPLEIYLFYRDALAADGWEVFEYPTNGKYYVFRGRRSCVFDYAEIIANTQGAYTLVVIHFEQGMRCL